MTPSQHALRIAMESRYPLAYAGNGWLYLASLFGLIVMSVLLLETFGHIGRQMWMDRKRPRDSVFALRLTFLIVSITAMVRIIPETIYRVAWNEASVETMQLIMSIKESFNLVAVCSLISWTLLFRYFEPLWTLRLSTSARVWGGNKKFVSQTFTIVFLSALLAGCITFYKSFS